MDCVVVGIGGGGKDSASLPGQAKTMAYLATEGAQMKNRLTRAVRVLPSGDIAFGKTIRNCLIYIMNTVSLQSDAGASLPAKHTSSADTSVSGLTWNRPEAF